MTSRVTQLAPEVITQDTSGASRVTQIASEVIAVVHDGASRVTQVVPELIVLDFGEGRVTHENVGLVGTEVPGPIRTTHQDVSFSGTGVPAFVRATSEYVSFGGNSVPSFARITTIYVNVLFSKRSEFVEVPGPPVDLSCICAGLTSLDVECTTITASPIVCMEVAPTIVPCVPVEAEDSVCEDTQGPGGPILIEEPFGIGSVTHIHVQVLRENLRKITHGTVRLHGRLYGVLSFIGD